LNELAIGVSVLVGGSRSECASGTIVVPSCRFGRVGIPTDEESWEAIAHRIHDIPELLPMACFIPTGLRRLFVDRAFGLAIAISRRLVLAFGGVGLYQDSSSEWWDELVPPPEHFPQGTSLAPIDDAFLKECSDLWLGVPFHPNDLREINRDELLKWRKEYEEAGLSEDYEEALAEATAATPLPAPRSHSGAPRAD